MTRPEPPGETDETDAGAAREAVKKHVAAIHVSGKLTLLQRKLSNVLLLNAYDRLREDPVHRIDAPTLCLMAGYNSNDLGTLKTSLRGLAEMVVEWDMLDEYGRKDWGVSSLLAHARLRDGVCDYAYSPALAEKLHDPAVFALINLDIQRRFTSGHALALYENCFRFVRTGSTGWWPIGLFRKLMGVEGKAYYENFKQLNAKIVKPAVAEVNRASDILVTAETRRAGRTVTDIRFRIRENPQLAILDLDDGAAVRKGPVYARLRELGVADRLARQWIAEHGEAAVAAKIDFVRGRPGVKAPARYLSAALRHGYGPEAEAETGAETGAAAGQGADTRQRAAQLRRVQALVAARSPTQRDADRRAFLARLKDPAARTDFENHGWMSPQNAEAIRAFWRELVPDAFAGLGPEG